MTDKPFISGCCEGERCFVCSYPAEHKVAEEIMPDDPVQERHPLTTYLCHRCFRSIMGSAADGAPGR